MICPIQIEDDSQDSHSQDDIYNVEFVYGKKFQKQIALYAVKWIGFSIKQMTWEPKTNFTNQSLYLIQRFESRLAYQIYQRQYNPKRVTTRVHIKQRFSQVFLAGPQKRNIQDKLEIPLDKTEQKTGALDIVDQKDEYEKALQIIDKWKKDLGIEDEKPEFIEANKQSKKGKKQVYKWALNISKKGLLSSTPKETSIKQLNIVKPKVQQKIRINPIDRDLERDIQLLIEREKQTQLQKQEQQNINHSQIIEFKETNQPLRFKKRLQECEIIDQRNQSQRIKEKGEKIIRDDNKKNKPQVKQTKFEQPNKKKEPKLKNQQKNLQDDFEIEIQFSDDASQIQLEFNKVLRKTLPLKNQDPQRKLIVKQNKVVKSAQNVPQNLKMVNQTQQIQHYTQELISFPKQKSEREYLNDIIEAQRKKELEIYRSGDLFEAVKKDPKSSTQPKTSQQLQEEIQRIQLEKIAMNKPSRCSVPIIPKLKEQEIQVNENEFSSFQQSQKIQERPTIESINSHELLNNKLMFQCQQENKTEQNYEFQSLKIICPTLLLDYMKTYSILI